MVDSEEYNGVKYFLKFSEADLKQKSKWTNKIHCFLRLNDSPNIKWVPPKRAKKKKEKKSGGQIKANILNTNKTGKYLIILLYQQKESTAGQEL